jgi:hypothetical protein
MAAEFDRAYVINGDDLRIALLDLAGKPITPGDAARNILSEHAQPLDETGLISQAQLAAIFHGFYLDVSHGGSIVKGIVRDPGKVADVVFREWSASRAHEPRDPWAPDDEVVDAHIHCEHAPASRAACELGQADQIVTILGRMPDRHVKRVMRFVWDYLTDDDAPPF